MIPFNQIPSALRYPGVYIEVDGSQAGLGGDIPAVLLVGQKLATGTAAAGQVVKASSAEDAKIKAGAGSMLAQMVERYRAVDQTLDLYMLPYSDNAAGVAATGAITVTTAPSVAGTLCLYVAGKLVSVALTTGMTTAQVATAIAAAFTDTNIPVTASAANAAVTLTARHKGTCGNNIDLRLSLYGETIPSGLALTMSAMTGGSGDPAPGDLTAMLGASQWYRYVALGINDAATLAAWDIESQLRYGPLRQAGFRAFTAIRGDDTTAGAFGATKNYPHIVGLSIELNPHTTWEYAATLTAAAAPALFNNPTQSLEGIKLTGMVGVSYHKPFPNGNSLLYKGISLMEVARDGACYIKRLVSMYQYRSDNSADDAYLDINVAETMERIRYEQRMGAIKKFRGTTAARNNEGYRPGLRITTEDSVKAFLLSLYKNVLMADYGWVQEYDHYKANLVVEQDATNPNRFNFRDTPVITSPFYILAGRSQFYKAVPQV